MISKHMINMRLLEIVDCYHILGFFESHLRRTAARAMSNEAGRNFLSVSSFFADIFSCTTLPPLKAVSIGFLRHERVWYSRQELVSGPARGVEG